MRWNSFVPILVVVVSFAGFWGSFITFKTICDTFNERNTNTIVLAETDENRNRVSQFIHSRVFRDNTLIVLVVSYGHLKFFLNWYNSFVKIVPKESKESFLLVSLDVEMYKEMQKRGIPSLFVSDILPELSGIAFSEVTYNTSDYNRLTNSKVEVVAKLLDNYNYTILFSDSDTVFTDRAIFDDLKQRAMNQPDIDIFFQGDKPDDPYFVCTGFYLVKPTTFSSRFIHGIIPPPEGAESQNDQEIAYFYIQKLPEEDKRKISILPVEKYVNGLGLDNGYMLHRPLMVHANWRVGSFAKEILLRDYNLWLPDDLDQKEN